MFYGYRCKLRAGPTRSCCCCLRASNCMATAGLTSRSTSAQRARSAAPFILRVEAWRCTATAGPCVALVLWYDPLCGVAVHCGLSAPDLRRKLLVSECAWVWPVLRRGDQDGEPACQITHGRRIAPEGARLSPPVSCNWFTQTLHAHVQVQCITHFLQLPIEDEFLADLAPDTRPGRPVAEEGAAPPAAPVDDPIPFADTGNPVMAQARSPC